MPFIQSYLEYTKELESATSFWKWSAYVAIASVLGDRCYRRAGNSVLYPNVYVMFLARSGGRKNQPVVDCEKMVNLVGVTKTISGRASVQSLQDELSEGETNSKTGMILKKGVASFFAPELAAGLVSDPEALGMFTDWYDYKPNPYKHRVRHGKKYDIEKIVFNMFTATNLDMGKSFMDARAISGGFLARNFLVVPSEFRPPNSFMYYEEDKELFKCCMGYLREIGKLSGEFKLEDDAAGLYNTWYNAHHKKYLSKPDPCGIMGRIHTSILKLSFILAADEGALVIRKHHMEEAIVEGLSLLPNYNLFIMSNGMSSIKDAAALVLRLLSENKDHTLTRSYILMHHYNDVDSEMLVKVTNTLQEAELITVNMSNPINVKYTLTAKCLDIMKKGGGED